MKIHFDNVSQFGTGPGTFANRLARRLFEFGHEVVFTCENADISLVFIERSGNPLARKVVQRLDGIWFKPEEFHTKNVRIKSLYDSADAVIIQSSFDYRMVNKWWGDPRSYEIIRNGIELNPVKELTIPSLIDIRSQYKKLYVCSSNWHPQKRLKANVELFEHLRRQEPSSCLIIMGSNPDFRVASPHVFYAGAVEPDVYNQIYSAADWMLHLAWADHCPNVVVEALAQGTPVACSEVGGTAELVGEYGMILKESPYNFELADYDNPPPIDVTQVTSLPTRHELDYSLIAEFIDINNVAHQYVSLFEKLIKQ